MNRTFLKKYLVSVRDVKDIWNDEVVEQFLVIGDIYNLEKRKIVEKRIEEIVKEHKIAYYEYDIEHMFEDEVIYLPREEQTNE